MITFSTKKAVLLGYFAFFVLIVYQTYLNARQAEAEAADLPAATMSVPAATPTRPVNQAIVAVPEVVPGLPVRISIPGLALDADIVKVGITKEEEIAAPKDPDQAGWYAFGPRPGGLGQAIIVGHSGWINRRPVIFDNIQRLKKGDRIIICDDRDQQFEFIVNSLVEYDSGASLGQIIPNTVKNGIFLITCAGDWDPVRQIYKQRLVIFAELQRSKIKI